jgi:hypothetical protein
VGIDFPNLWIFLQYVYENFVDFGVIMDNYDIYVIGKILNFLVEKQCDNEQCPKCYEICGDCPKNLIGEFLNRNNIK